MTEPHRNPSSTPPPVTEEMIEAGNNALKGLSLGIYYREQLTEVYLAMHAARSNQEATPDAELREAAIAVGSALDDWIKIIDTRAPLNPDLKHYFWKRSPTWDEVQEAMRANNALAEALAKPVQEATRTVGDAELTSAVVDKIERRLIALESFTGTVGQYADRDGEWSVQDIVAELRALSHTSSCGGI
jgi:hypothetical protein